MNWQGRGLYLDDAPLKQTSSLNLVAVRIGVLPNAGQPEVCIFCWKPYAVGLF